ncbi:glycosyltransferase family 2 protein [Candidatus Gracilibacteria bacterium]|nr:glycosyltransferase family 2 protein [Candidatus Gracilibacteria bacterium]
MKSIKLSIVTVNFGSADKVKRLWDSIQKYPPSVPFECIIVDNPTRKNQDSADLTRIFQNEKNVHLVLLSENGGYGAGNAEGVRFASGEFLAIVNPDVEVTEHTFDILLKTLQADEKNGVVVPLLKTHDGKILENARPFPNIMKLLRRRLFGSQIIKAKEQIQKIREIDWAQGSFLVLRKELFEKLDGFDERFFLFFEDTDFCRRVWNEKLKVLQNPHAIAIHSPNRLSGGNIFKALGRKTFWIHVSSMLKYFWKWK